MISSSELGVSIKQWRNVLGLKETPDSTDEITTSIAPYEQKFWKNDCDFVVLQAWTAPGYGHGMNYEEEAWMEFFGLDSVGGKDPGLEACKDTGTSSIGNAKKATPVHKSFFLKEKTLVLNMLSADEVSVKILNTAGQIQYFRNHKVRSNTGSVSIPLPFLPSGYFISSVVFYEGTKRINSNNVHFVLTK